LWVSGSNADLPILWRFPHDAEDAKWAFYLFPTRAWELLAGSICAWLMINRPITVPTVVKVCSLFVIILVSCIGFDPIHPRGDAILVVLATSLILLGGNNWLPKYSIVRYMEKMGDWSYSIYLVHWPIFTFSYLGYAGQVPLSTKVLLVFISIFLGYLQYRFIETPFRHGWNKQSSKTWAWLTLSTFTVIAIPIPMALSGGRVAPTKPYLIMLKLEELIMGYL